MKIKLLTGGGFLSWRKPFLLFFLVLMTISVFGQSTTATYTVASTSAVTPSGTLPSGSSAAYEQTYNTAGQMTNANSTKLTLSGYAGQKITGITLNMRSNASAGAGNMSAVAGSTTIASIATNTFSSSAWYGNYSSSYVNVNPAVAAYTVEVGETIVISIAATVNSLFINSYTITYQSIPIDPADHLTFTSTATTPAVGGANTYVVSAQNSSEKTDPAYTGSVVLSKVSGPGTVGGTLMKSAVTGIATFND